MDVYEMPYRTVSRARSVWRFITSPKSFVADAIAHDIAYAQVGNEYLRAQIQADEHQRNRIESETCERVGLQYGLLRTSLFRSGALVLCSAVTGLVIGNACRLLLGPAPSVNAGLQLAGGGIVLWVTIWHLDPDTRSVGGDTLVERVHSWLYRTLYVLGTTLFFIAYAWGA